MRTTINLSPAALHAARKYAAARAMSLSDAVSDLIVLAQLRPPRLRMDGEFLVVAKRAGATKISPATIAKLMNDE